MKGEFKENQIAQGWLPALKQSCGYPAALVFAAKEGLLYFGTYWEKALIFFALPHKLFSSR